MTNSTPSLWQRVLPLMVFGWIIAAARLYMDASYHYGGWFGIYWVMPAAFLVVGLLGKWGTVRWTTMAGTMVLVACLVWGVWNSIAYTTGQFMEWEFGRYYPGAPVTLENRKAAPVQDTAMMKLAMGLLHGVLSSLTSTVWCIGFGTLFIWLPAKLRKNAPTP